MKGKDLQEIIKLNKLKVADLIKKTGLKRRTFFSLYDKDNIEPFYIKMLIKAGVPINFVENQGVPLEMPEKQKINEENEKKYLELRTTIQDQRDLIEDYKNLCSEYKAEIADLRLKTQEMEAIIKNKDYELSGMRGMQKSGDTTASKPDKKRTDTKKG
jgi:predicted RNase H-like nuclease (RuvC/YqgF family)